MPLPFNPFGGGMPPQYGSPEYGMMSTQYGSLPPEVMNALRIVQMQPFQNQMTQHLLARSGMTGSGPYSDSMSAAGAPSVPTLAGMAGGYNAPMGSAPMGSSMGSNWMQNLANRPMAPRIGGPAGSTKSKVMGTPAGAPSPDASTGYTPAQPITLSTMAGGDSRDYNNRRR